MTVSDTHADENERLRDHASRLLTENAVLRAEIDRERVRADRAEAVLERVRAVEWREEVDSNGEYTTERYRNASTVRSEIEAALSAGETTDG